MYRYLCYINYHDGHCDTVKTIRATTPAGKTTETPRPYTRVNVSVSNVSSTYPM